MRAELTRFFSTKGKIVMKKRMSPEFASKMRYIDSHTFSADVNRTTKEVHIVVEEKTITNNDIVNALRKANIPDNEYSMEGYCESCLCIEPINNGWQIYHGEMGTKHNVVIVTILDTLVSEVCNRLGYDKPKSYSASTRPTSIAQNAYDIKLTYTPPIKRGRALRYAIMQVNSEVNKGKKKTIKENVNKHQKSMTKSREHSKLK